VRRRWPEQSAGGGGGASCRQRQRAMAVDMRARGVGNIIFLVVLFILARLVFKNTPYARYEAFPGVFQKNQIVGIGQHLSHHQIHSCTVA
jgi:hypothetical protein